MFNVTFFWDITFYCYNLSWVSEISVFHVVSFNHFHLRYVAIYCVYLIGHFYLIYFRPFYLRHCRPLLSETFPASFIWDILSHFYLNTFQATFISDILSHFLKTFHASFIYYISCQFDLKDCRPSTCWPAQERRKNASADTSHPYHSHHPPIW